MTHLRYLRALITAFVLFVILDAVWHGGIMADFYNQRLMLLNPAMVNAPVTFSPFILFLEALNAAALSYFILTHVEDDTPLVDAAWVGGLLGVTVTGTLNFLNHTLIPQWDIQLALVDTAWGTVAGIITGLAVALVCGPLRKRRWFGWGR